MTSTKADKINEDSRTRTNKIIAYAQLEGATKLLKGDMTIHYTSNSHGVTGTRIEIYIPDEHKNV